MTAKAIWAVRLSTWFGAGYSPVAPGTLGALGAVPLHLLLRRTHPLLHAAVVMAVSAVGVWSAGEVARQLEQDDPQSVVIDEVAGTLIAMGLVRKRSALVQLLALGAFRVLDITKPGPIHHLQHTQPPGLGIVVDDLLAGLMAGLGARLLPRLGRR